MKKFIFITFIFTAIAIAGDIPFNSFNLNNLSWVWSTDSKAPNPGSAFFRKTFSLPDGADITKAIMYITADDEFFVYVNGIFCGSNNEWKVVNSIDIKSVPRVCRGRLQPAKNAESQTNAVVVCIKAINAGKKANACGLIGKIILLYKNGNISEIPIDNSWKCSETFYKNWKTLNFDDSNWKNAFSIVPYGSHPWGPFDSAKHLKTQFPKFIVPGFEKEMNTLRELFILHYPGASPKATLWDPWLAFSSLWPDSDYSNFMKSQWRKALLDRKISGEGYVTCAMGGGMAHNDGWPLPLPNQMNGKDWCFSLSGGIYGAPHGVFQTTNIVDWTLQNASSGGINPDAGWNISLTKNASITTPEFKCDTYVAPFIRLDWIVNDFPEFSQPYLEWATEAEPEFSENRRMYFSPIVSDKDYHFTHIPLYKLQNYTGTLTRLRINFNNSKPAKIVLRTIITATDSRHSINSLCFTKGSIDYFKWTRDLSFLRKNINRMRLAMRFFISEFKTRENKCVVNSWVGHAGRSGIKVDENGKRIEVYGRGIGSSYFDLLPGGGTPGVANIYFYDTLLCMANLEEQILKHPEWNISVGPLRFNPKHLRRHAKEIKDNAAEKLWSEETGRFAYNLDADNIKWDFGYTILNLESICYGFASSNQAVSIMDWITGKRVVKGDTSVGKDIYHWRFAPRCSTKRNINYYPAGWLYWADKTPFGYQVQDGGAVMGFSYFDIMARLKILGADNAWQQLQKIIKWFDDVQKEGGYRKYYSGKYPERGSLQGGDVPGGLGLDEEFFESVLVPQVMLYGFLGFQPDCDGFSINHKLPENWPELKITRIKLHDYSLDVTVSKSKIIIEITDGTPDFSETIFPPKGRWQASYFNSKGGEIKVEKIIVTAKHPGIPLCKSGSTRLELKRTL